MDYINLITQIFTYVGVAYALAQVIVLITPTKKDDEILGKVEAFARAFLEVAKNVKGKK